MKKIKVYFFLFFVVGLLFISGCVEDSGDVIVTKRESQTYFLTLQSNLTESVGDGVTYLYLDVPGSENRTFYDFIGDDNR